MEKRRLNLFNIAVMVSGSGSNLQAIIDSIESGQIPDAQVGLVISDKASAYALERAQAHSIPNLYIPKGEDEALLEALETYKIDFIVLAGYLSILAKEVVSRYPDRILNIHPSLIPKYCGKGFYGLRVHESVVAAGEKESGATVHYVDAGIDTGKIILQRKVTLDPGETAESLQKKVLEIEHQILPEAIHLALNQIKLEEENEGNH